MGNAQRSSHNFPRVIIVDDGERAVVVVGGDGCVLCADGDDHGCTIRVRARLMADLRAIQTPLNNSATTTSSIALTGKRLRYTLSAPGGTSTSVKLNGTVLQLQSNDGLPALAGVGENSRVANFMPRTISFVVLPDAKHPGCSIG